MRSTQIIIDDIAYDYFIFDDGRVQNSEGKFLKQHIRGSNGGAYPYVTLYKNKKPKKYSVHILVAKHFVPNPHNKPEVDHIDRDRKNCCFKNLRWSTKSENLKNRSSWSCA